VNVSDQGDTDAVAAATRRWFNPSPYFSSGQDRRSSDNALLAALYGGLYKSALHDFQNAGRVLVDRTDLRILLESYLFALPVRQLDLCCRHLDTFVRKNIYPAWEDLHAGKSDLHQLALQWTRSVATECLGDQSYCGQAGCLLFFLCPMLPTTLVEAESGSISANAGKPPLVMCQDEAIQGQLRHLLQSTRWWPRRVQWQQTILSRSSSVLSPV